MKSVLFNFSLPGLTELLCRLPGNCNLRDTSAESVLNKTPTIFSLYFMLLVFFLSSTYLSLAVFISVYFSNGGKKGCF